jgi:hypothetical protein
MQEIGSGPSYRVEVDMPKNRIYLWFFGEAVNDASVAGLLEAVKGACDLMKPGFTGLADFTDMKLMGLPDVAQKTQTLLMEAGLRKLASVWDHESFAKIIVDSSAQKVKSGEYSERRRVFKNRVEAEAWLA